MAMTITAGWTIVFEKRLPRVERIGVRRYPAVLARSGAGASRTPLKRMAGNSGPKSPDRRERAIEGNKKGQ
jgi:hypothetical protein